MSGEKVTVGQRKSWFVAHTQPHLEYRAVVHLRQQGFSVFLPRRLKTIKHARQYRTVTAPLFPGYVFVEIDLHRDRWRAINGTAGIRSLVMTGDRPAMVPPGVVEGLRTMLDSSGIVSFVPNLIAGQRVRLLAGPFAEMIGQLHRLDDAGRVEVLLELLGSQVRVRARAAVLVPA